MVTFSFREFGENLGTRQLGQQVREKLMLTMPLSELKAHTTFRGLNPLASESVLTALRRRHLVMS